MFNDLNQHMEAFSRTPTTIEKPKHWTKGIELCNRTACQSARNVIFRNHSNKAYYCVKCVRLINSNGTLNGIPLCSIDEDKQIYENEFKNDGNDLTYNEYKKGKEIFEF